MAEQEPPVVKAPKDERDEVVKLQRQLERAQFDATQKEAFGKYDVTAPNEGEDTYQSYLDQRPNEGVVRNGDLLQDAKSGKFATEAAYQAQQVNSQDYYDQQGGLVNAGEYQPPNYEAMGVLQLAKEAAKARQLGDPAEEKTVREALEHYLTMDAMKDDTESPEEAQARFESELGRFDSLVDRFIGRPGPEAQESKDTHVASKGEGDPSQRNPEAEAPKPREAKSEAEAPSETEVSLNGEKVTINEVFTSPDGRRAVEVTGDDGVKRLVFEAELSFDKPKAADAITEEPVEDVKTPTTEFVVDSNGVIEPPEAQPEADDLEKLEGMFNDEAKQPGKELELFKGEEAESSKKWWKKAIDRLRPLAGAAAWSAAWLEVNVAERVRSRAGQLLDHGVEDTMTADEKESRRKKNRYIAIGAGVALVAAGAIVGGVLAANGFSSGSDHASSGIGLGEHNDWLQQQADGSSTPSGNEGLRLIPIETEGVGVENLSDVPAPSEVINVGSGQGGIELFSGLGLNEDSWNANAQTLLNQFPQDFYSEGGDVRLMHSGQLSQGAQDFINSLRRG